MFILPLWYSPLTQSLSLQKNVVLTLGVCFTASAAGPWSALFIAAGALLSLAFPEGAAVIAPVFVLPSLISFFRAHPSLRWLSWSATLIAALALSQWLGASLFEGSTSQFSLPYAALTATLGNPNYLSLFLFFTLLLLAPSHTKDESASTSGPGRWIQPAVLLLVILLARSFLGWILLLLWLVGIALWKRKFLLLGIGGVTGGALLFAYQGAFLRALEGRFYLAQVYLSSASGAVWIQGVGPGNEAASFLHWQADFLQRHPEYIRLWTHPEYAHNDLISLAATWGALTFVAMGAAVYFNRCRPPRARSLLWIALVLVAALGATVLYVSPVLVLAAALLAQTTEPRRPSSSPTRWTKYIAGLASLVLLAVTSLQAYSDYLSTSATQAAMSGRLPAARALVTEAQALPFQQEHLFFLQGRISLEGRDWSAAKDAFQQARERLPHPQVLRPLLFACQQLKDAACLSEVLQQQKLYAPRD